MRVVVSANDFAEHLKARTLPHVHHRIDDATVRYVASHRCPRTLLDEVFAIPEVARADVAAYIREAAASSFHPLPSSVTTFGTVYDDAT